jgi:hypothetical protein
MSGVWLHRQRQPWLRFGFVPSLPGAQWPPCLAGEQGELASRRRSLSPCPQAWTGRAARGRFHRRACGRRGVAPADRGEDPAKYPCIGAAGVWWPIRPSKPARRRSPTLGRFDSFAASSIEACKIRPDGQCADHGGFEGSSGCTGCTPTGTIAQTIARDLLSPRHRANTNAVASAKPQLPTGIYARHARHCASRRDEECSCAPSYQAQVWSARDNKPLRKTFP